MELNLELYKENDLFYAYLADCNSSGIKCKGNTPQECIEKLSLYLENYFEQI